MIKLIGLKRIFILLIILGINALIGGVYTMVLMPARDSTQASLDSANAEISKLTGDIQNVKTELATYASKVDQYEALKKAGFYLQQDRFQASRMLDAILQGSGLRGYNYKMAAIQIVPNADAAKTNGDLISSQITFDGIKSVLDTTVYDFVPKLVAGMPQHVRFKKLEIKKSKEVTPETLKTLNDPKEGLIEATLDMEWMTVVSKPKPADNAANPLGGR